MKESDLRKWHRRMGIGLALFIVFQAGSGLLLSLGQIETTHSHADTELIAHKDTHAHDEEESVRHGLIGLVHHGYGSAGAVYRVLVGIMTIGMAASGTVIYFKIRARTKKT